MCGGASGARRGEARCGVRNERSTPEHSGCPEAGASLPLPTAADFLSGASIADGASEPSSATHKNRRSGGVGVATP